MFWSAPIYLPYKIWQTAHSQLSLFSPNLSIRFQNSFFLSYPTFSICLRLLLFRSSHSHPLIMKSIFAGEAALKMMSEVNPAFGVHVMETIKTKNVRAQFNICRFRENIFWNRICFQTPFQKKNLEVKTANTSACSKPLKLKMFARFPDFNLQKMGTGQVWQGLRACLAVATYAEKKSLRAWALWYPLPRWKEFHGNSQWRSIFSHGSQRRTARLFHYDGHHNCFSSQDSNLFFKSIDMA